MESQVKFQVSDENMTDETVIITKSEYDALKKKSEDANQLHEKLLRLHAEFENYKKFTERQKTHYLKYGNEKLLREIIKIYDDLKRALKDIKDAQISHGLKLILTNFSALLKSEGIEPIEAEGQVFDPDLHECMLIEQNPSLPDGFVTEVLEHGYKLNGKVLRPSKVKVNK